MFNEILQIIENNLYMEQKQIDYVQLLTNNLNKNTISL